VKRAEDEERTRARIVDAAEGLHAELGPARATIAAIAERAGVTRATVYRHFADSDALFLACAGQWLARQVLPDPASWAADDPFVVLDLGLTDIYRYFRAGEPMLSSVIRDEAVVPALVRDVRLRREQEWRERLLHRLPGRRRGVVRAAVAHATRFGTWRALCVEEGLTDRAAVDLMLAMTAGAVDGWHHT